MEALYLQSQDMDFPNTLAAATSGELIVLAGSKACTIQDSNSTVIVCITKAGVTAGVLEVTYKNHTDNSQKLTLFATPATITNITPSIVNPALKTEITITGTNFDRDINKVIIKNTTLKFSEECIVRNSSTTEINCTLMGVMDNSYVQFSLSPTGFYNMLVVTPTGYSAPVNFQARTVITNISPSNGSTTNGTLFTIRGGPFSTNSSETAVFIGDKNTTCKVINSTSTQIMCQDEASLLSNQGVTRKIYVVTNSLAVKEAQCEDGTGCMFTYPENNAILRDVTNTNSSTRYWSDPAQWPKGVVPQAGDNVTIPANHTIILDGDTSSLGTLIIEGSLYFSSSAPNLTLTAEIIWVKGQLFIGTSSIDRHNNSARILLTGLSKANTLAINATQLAPSKKILVVTGNLTIYGRAVNNVYTRLQAPATIGAKNITVPANIDWKVGDKIFIAPSQKNYSEYETRTIAAINNGVITLDQALNYYHHGAPAATKTTPYGTLDMRAEVGLLTRKRRDRRYTSRKLGWQNLHSSNTIQSR